MSHATLMQFLLPAILATPPYTAVLAGAQPAALLARVSLAVDKEGSYVNDLFNALQ